MQCNAHTKGQNNLGLEALFGLVTTSNRILATSSCAKIYALQDIHVITLQEGKQKYFLP